MHTVAASTGSTLLIGSVTGGVIGVAAGLALDEVWFIPVAMLAAGVGSWLARQQMVRIFRQEQTRQETEEQIRQQQWEAERAELLAELNALRQRLQTLEAATAAPEPTETGDPAHPAVEAELNGKTYRETLQQFWVQSWERLQPYLQLLGDQLEHVQQESEQAALEIVSELQRLHEAAQRQIGQIQQLSESMERMVRHNAEQSQSIREAGQQMNAFVDQHQLRIEESLQRINHMASEVGQLHSLVDEMGDIARRTNLLALNAAIEAARLGEGGKGFAVVADAVQQLAVQARGLAERMGRQIEEVGQRIQEETERIEMQLHQEHDQLNQLRSLNIALNDRLEQIAQVTSTTVAQVSLLNDEMLSRSLADLLGRIQFQDVLRQKIDLVREALDRLAAFLKAAVHYQQHPEQSPPEMLDPEKLYQRYVSAGQRVVHQTTLGHHKADVEDTTRIELFL